MIKNIFSVANYTIREIIRNKIFYVLILFGIILLGTSVLFGLMGGTQQVRMVLDLGLGTMEILSLIISIFSAVSLVLEEMEAKTIYLILTRPVSRAVYIIGRYIGLVTSVTLSLLIMMIAHFCLLLLKGWEFTPMYFLIVLMILWKVLIITSLAMFFSLFSTSNVAAISFTAFFWVLGHFGEELKFLGNKIGNPFTKMLLKFFYYIMPNFQYFNLRDQLGAFQGLERWMFIAIGYGLIYISACIILTIMLFDRKEF